VKKRPEWFKAAENSVDDKRVFSGKGHENLALSSLCVLECRQGRQGNEARHFYLMTSAGRLLAIVACFIPLAPLAAF
jgi:hypothetical protein